MFDQLISVRACVCVHISQVSLCWSSQFDKNVSVRSCFQSFSVLLFYISGGENIPVAHLIRTLPRFWVESQTNGVQ